jgi:predicted kinase
MCGLPFSGKSTVARRICEHRQAALIGLDQINEERGLGFGGDGQISRSKWKETHQIALAHLEKLSASGQDIVIDDTNCFRFLRDSYRNLGSRLNYRTVIVQMTLSS